MKVSLWAEIRRLHEIERCRRRAIARRLHCCDKTVRKALPMASPPSSTVTRAVAAASSSLTTRRSTRLIAKYPDLSAVRVLEEIAQGTGGLSRERLPGAAVSASDSSRRGRVYQEVIYEPGEAMQVDWGDCGR